MIICKNFHYVTGPKNTVFTIIQVLKAVYGQHVLRFIRESSTL